MQANLETVDNVKGNEALNVLLVGNNPIELGAVLDKIHQIRTRKIMAEIAFDLNSLLERLVRFKPNFIIIDDNIGKLSLNEAIHALSQNRKTKDIPVTVLKNSNYEESHGKEPVLDYVLKHNLSAESLLNTIKNSIKLKRTQLYLHNAYSVRKKQLLRAFAS